MHFYDRYGNPCYTQPNKSKPGQERPTTTADARKLLLAPSVTTVMDVLAKHALTDWKIKKALEATILEPFVKGWHDADDWVKSMMAAGNKIGSEAAKTGTQIHDALEHAIKTGKTKKGFKKYVEPVMNYLHKNFPDRELIAEASFVSPLGYGGKVDLHIDDGMGEGLVLDFKSKSTDNFSRVKAYDEHKMQLAAYIEGLGLQFARGINLFIHVDSAEIKEHEWSEKELQEGWEMFKCALKFWQLKYNYDSSFNF